MLKMILRCLLGSSAFFCSVSVFAQSVYPPYLVEFIKGPLNSFVEPIKSHIRLRTEVVEDGTTHLILEVFAPQRRPQDAKRVYSQYTIGFSKGVQTVAVPEVMIHRFQDRNGDYLRPAITGSVTIPLENGQLRKGQDLAGVLRSLFRADQTLHPLFANPYLPDKGKRLTLPQTQAIVGQEIVGVKIPGMVDFYKEHMAEAGDKPMHAAFILPTGVGKTVLALRYLQFVEVFTKAKPLVIFVVENKQILDDVHQKFMEVYESRQVARLYGEGTQSILTSEISAILATRTTAHARLDEIIRFAKSRGQPVILFRDEAHRTGREGGQFARINDRFMSEMSLRDQVIDLTATPWHDERPEMIRDYKGRVATTFVSPEEYSQFVDGNKVSIMSRVQLLRAIFSGWLAPLTSMSFITQDIESNKEQVSFRRSLQQEQEGLAKKLGIPAEELFTVSFETLTEEQVQGLRKYIRDVHEPIIRALYQDILNQQMRDQSGKIAEYDRGLIFVPTILHAEIYKEILNQMAKSHNISFRAIHSKMNGAGRGTVGENIDWLNDLDRSNLHTHKYLINVAMAREGVDIPGVNRILYVTTTDSIKVLLQAFGRATRLSPLKSGVRMTDFGGSYLDFFKEIPSQLLARLLTPKDTVRSGDTIGDARPTIRHNQKAIGVQELVSLQIENPMAELVEVITKDESKLADPVEAEKIEKRVAAEELRQGLQKYEWSLPPTLQNRGEVQKIVSTLEQLGPEELATARKELKDVWMRLALPWYYYFLDYHPSKMDEGMRRVEPFIRGGRGKEKILRVYQALNSPQAEVLLDGIYLNAYASDPKNYRTVEAYVLFMNLMGTGEGRRKLANARGIETVLDRLIVDPKPLFEGNTWVADPRWISTSFMIDSIIRKHGESVDGRLGPALVGTPLGDGNLRHEIPYTRAGLIVAQHRPTSFTAELDSYFLEPNLKKSPLFAIQTSIHSLEHSRSDRDKVSLEGSGFQVFKGSVSFLGGVLFSYSQGPMLLEIEMALRLQDILVKVASKMGARRQGHIVVSEFVDQFSDRMLSATRHLITQGGDGGLPFAQAAKAVQFDMKTGFIWRRANHLFETLRAGHLPTDPEIVESKTASRSDALWLNFMRKISYAKSIPDDPVTREAMERLFSMDYGFEISQEMRLVENADWLMESLGDFLRESEAKSSFYPLLYSSYRDAKETGRYLYMMLPLVLGFERFDVRAVSKLRQGSVLVAEIPRLVELFKTKYKDHLDKLNLSDVFIGEFLDPMTPEKNTEMTEGRLRWMDVVNFLTMLSLAKRYGYEKIFLEANEPIPQMDLKINRMIRMEDLEKERRQLVGRTAEKLPPKAMADGPSLALPSPASTPPLFADYEARFANSFPRPTTQEDVQRIVNQMTEIRVDDFSKELLALLRLYWRPLSLPWYYHLQDMLMPSGMITANFQRSRSDIDQNFEKAMGEVQPLIREGKTLVYQALDSELVRFLPKDVVENRKLFQDKALMSKIETYILFQSYLATESGRVSLANSVGIGRALENLLSMDPVIETRNSNNWAQDPRWIESNLEFGSVVRDNGYQLEFFSTALRGMPVDLAGRRTEFSHWRSLLVAAQQTNPKLKGTLYRQYLEPELLPPRIFTNVNLMKGVPGPLRFFDIVYFQDGSYSDMERVGIETHYTYTLPRSEIFNVERDLWIQNLLIKLAEDRGREVLGNFGDSVSTRTQKIIEASANATGGRIFSMTDLLDSLPRLSEALLNGELSPIDQVRVLEEVRNNRTEFPVEIRGYESDLEAGEILFEVYRRVLGKKQNWLDNFSDSPELKILVEFLAAHQSLSDFPEREKIQAHKKWLLSSADDYLRGLGIRDGQLDFLFSHYRNTEDSIGRRMFMLIPLVHYAEYLDRETLRRVSKERLRIIRQVSEEFRKFFASELADLQIERAFNFDSKAVAEQVALFDADREKPSFQDPRIELNRQYADFSAPGRSYRNGRDPRRLRWMQVVDYLTVEVLAGKFGVRHILNDPSLGREILERTSSREKTTPRPSPAKLNFMKVTTPGTGLRCSQIFAI